MVLIPDLFFQPKETLLCIPLSAPGHFMISDDESLNVSNCRKGPPRVLEEYVYGLRKKPPNSLMVMNPIAISVYANPPLQLCKYPRAGTLCPICVTENDTGLILLENQVMV